MAVPEPHESPTADRDLDWDWGEEGAEYTDDLLDHDGWEAMVTAHAWYDDSEGEPPEKKTAYKLPHHRLVDGQIRAVWAGVESAMNVVEGGRGGVDLPEDEIDDVYEHLAAHYEEFDEQPPERPTG